MCLTCLLAQPMSKSSLVNLLVWNHPLHTPHISSPNHCLLFTTHPYHRNLFCCSTEIIFLSLFQLYLNATHPSDHSHLCLLKCHIIFFPFRPGRTSTQHTTFTIKMKSSIYLPSNGGRCISPVSQPAAEQQRSSTKMANRFPPGRADSPVIDNRAPYSTQAIKMRTVNRARRPCMGHMNA